jgi:peptide/nickel transport system permease protein
MLQFLLRRLAALLPVLLVVSLVVFLILRLAPGDPAAVIAGNSATNEEIDKIRNQLGLDRSIPVQYGIWIGRVLQGDLGYSFYLSKPVTALIAQRIEPTLALAIGTALLAVLIAVPLGTLAAWRMGGVLD